MLDNAESGPAPACPGRWPRSCRCSQSLPRAQGSEPLLVVPAAGRSRSTRGSTSSRSRTELLDSVAEGAARPGCATGSRATRARCWRPGSPIPSLPAAYFEVVDLADLEETLRQLGAVADRGRA